MSTVVARVNRFVLRYYGLFIGIVIMGLLMFVALGIIWTFASHMAELQHAEARAKASLEQQGFVIASIGANNRFAFLVNGNCSVRVALREAEDGKWIVTPDGSGDQSQPLTPSSLPPC